MKLVSLMLCFVLLGPAAAYAQEKTLVAISQDMFAVVEAYAACADNETICTADDVQELQSAAAHSLGDLARLLRSGRLQSLHITAGQALLLSQRARALRNRLQGLPRLDAMCNGAILAFADAVFFLNQVFYYGLAGLVINFGTLWWFVVVAALPILFVFALACVLSAFLLMAPCLFWWL